MKVYLVIFFLMQNGTWLPGDLIAPDGWSSLQFNTLEQCEERRSIFNENMKRFSSIIKAECQTLDPTIPRTKI